MVTTVLAEWSCGAVSVAVILAFPAVAGIVEALKLSQVLEGNARNLSGDVEVKGPQLN